MRTSLTELAAAETDETCTQIVDVECQLGACFQKQEIIIYYKEKVAVRMRAKAQKEADKKAQKAANSRNSSRTW